MSNGETDKYTHTHITKHTHIHTHSFNSPWCIIYTHTHVHKNMITIRHAIAQLTCPKGGKNVEYVGYRRC